MHLNMKTLGQYKPTTDNIIIMVGRQNIPTVNI